MYIDAQNTKKLPIINNAGVIFISLAPVVKVQKSLPAAES